MAFPRGYDLIKAIREFRIPTDKVIFPKADPALIPLEDEQFAKIYSACDLYVSASMGEGFGLPIIESMACETPCIAPNNSTHPELIEGHGWIVETIPTDVWVDVPVWVPTLQQYSVVNMSKMVDTIKEACRRRELIEEYGKEARRFVIENYDWEKAGIIDKWCSLLNRVEEEINILYVNK
jgi:glycosyltransferase involved in cell wall biosynthesis